MRIKEGNQYLNLNEIPFESGTLTILDLISKFCDEYKKEPFIWKEERKTLSIAKAETENSSIYGIVKLGEFGYDQDFYDIETRQRIPKAKKERHSEELPLFFLFYYKPYFAFEDVGFLVLQRFKRTGMKTVLTKALNEYVSKPTSTRKLKFEIHPLINTNLLGKIDSADRIVSIRLLSRDVPKDCADELFIENYKDLHEERIFRMSRGGGFAKNIIKKIIEKLKKEKSTYLEIAGEKYEEIKVDLEIGKSSKTVVISLEGPYKFREELNLDEKELEFEGGFPTASSLLPHAEKYLKKVMEGYKGGNVIESE
ncbi:MAG: hypothetical protein ACTSR0_06375 [Candidatus Asgardarchaeia archaeon]